MGTLLLSYIRKLAKGFCERAGEYTHRVVERL